jgi:hypothetical protein
MTAVAAVVMPVCLGVAVWQIGNAVDAHVLVSPEPGWPQVTGFVAGTHLAIDGKYYVPAPVVAFTADGRTFRFGAPISLPQPKVGERALVAYNPKDPAEAHDLSDRTGWLSSYWVGVVALLFASLGTLVVGMLLAISWRRTTASGRGSPNPSSGTSGVA